MDNRILNELLWAQIFNNTIAGSDWLSHKVSFSPGKMAVGYPYLYVLYRILDEVRPTKILETGLGQSTKMMGSYISHFSTQSDEYQHYVVEHDLNWIQFFTKRFSLSDSSQIVKLPMMKGQAAMENGEDIFFFTYQNFKERFQKEKFDLISIDGPFGGGSLYSRIDILDILPECLEKSFVIMIDDYERIGEKNTVKLATLILRENSIPFNMGVYSGKKDVCVLASEDWKFLCSL